MAGHQLVAACGRRPDNRKYWPIKVDSNGALDVYIQDQTTNAYSFYVEQIKGLVTLATPFTVNTSTMNLVAGHGFSVGDYVVIIEEDISYQARAVNVAVNTITLDAPSPATFTVDAPAARSIVNMNVNGSATPQIFNINPVGSAVWDIVKFTFLIEDEVVMDTAKFGGIAALTNGIVVRKKTSNAEYHNLFTIHTNGEFELNSGLTNYQDKAPAGVYGFMSKHTLGGQDNFGVVIRLRGTNLEEFQVVIQDDLRALTKFNATVQLHEVSE